MPIVRVGRHRGTYATYILCHNCRTDVESQLSFNQIEKVLECCELVEGYNVNVITKDTIAIICQDKDKLIHLKPNKAEIEFVSSVGFYENNLDNSPKT